MAAAPGSGGTKAPGQSNLRNVPPLHAAASDDMPPRLPPQVPRVLMSASGPQRASRQTQSARGTRDGRRDIAPDRPASRGAPGESGNSLEHRALKRIFAKKTQLEARYQDASPQLPRPPWNTGSENMNEGAGSNIVDQFLHQLNETAPARLGTLGHTTNLAEEEWQNTLPMSDYATWMSGVNMPTDSRGSNRMAKEVKELKEKVVRMERERHKLQAQLKEKEERVKELEDDVKRIRSEPTMLHPAIQRLRKVGLNTAAMSDLNERWAGYVLGRTSMAMEVGSYAFRAVFATHAQNGVLTEDSFKSVIRQFEPTIKNDQLTRLWFFADSDGSGQLDLFEFMRMFGCNANGEMSDEYYEVVTMHMYRKFHSKGGIRRVYAAADRDQDQCLTPEEWEHFLQQARIGCSRQDYNMSKQEMCQVFQRMNTANNGLLSIVEFEAALDAAAAKCYVSERWVRETFHATAVAIQDEGANIKQLIPTGNLTAKEFKDLMLHFTPRLRISQLDRLWKYVLAQTALAEDKLARPSESINRVDTDAFLKIAFGPTLGISGSSISETGGAEGNDGTSAQHSSTGKEVLEQLAILLRKHTGDVPLELCFESLDPFLTPDHFHKQLLTKFGLQYDTIKTKQMFSLIDMDRDGKITRYEFLSTFKRILRSGDESPETSACENGTEVTAKMRENRLLNRVHMMENDMRQSRSHPGASSGNYGDPITMIPEKQYRTLEIAHAKLNHMIQRERELHAKREKSGSPRRSATVSQTGSPKRLLARQETLEGTESSTLDSLMFRGSMRLERHGSMAKQESFETESMSLRDMRLGKPVSPLYGRHESSEGLGFAKVITDSSTESVPLHRMGSIAFGSAGSMWGGDDHRVEDLEEKVARLTANEIQLAKDFNARMEALLAENAYYRDRLDSVVSGVEVSPGMPVSMQKTWADEGSLPESSPNPNTMRSSKTEPSRKTELESATLDLERELFGYEVSEDIDQKNDGLEEDADTSPNSEDDMRSRKSLGRKREAKVTVSAEGRRPSRDAARMTIAKRPGSVLIPASVPPQGVSKVCRALWAFLKDKRGLKDRISGLNQELVGAIVEDRFRIDQVLSVSQKAILTYCWDLLLNSVVSVRLLYDTKMQNRRDFSYEVCVMSKLMSIPHIPTVYHFSGANSSLVFFAMELLEGETLAARFLAVQEDRAEPINNLEAMEVADALLNGVDQCHQQDVVNLSIRPDTVWIAPPLSAARVRILSWENALPINSQPINAEFHALAEDRRLESSKIPPRLVRGTDEADVTSKGDAAAPGQVYANKVDRAFPNLFVKDVGSLYYMPPEHLYSVIHLHQADAARGGPTEWASKVVGPAAKVDGPVVHWFQRGNGIVMTATPAACVSLGRLFEVEIHKIMTMVRRGSADLGFCIGLTTLSPKLVGKELSGDREKFFQDAFVANGDCSFSIRGKRLVARAHGLGVEEISQLRISDTEGRYMIIPENLRRGDRIGILAEWNGDLSVYINGEQVGCCPGALKPTEVFSQLYGCVDMYTREGADEHYVRAIELGGEEQVLAAHFGGERGSKKAQELGIIYDLVQTSVESQLGVPCDVYASGLVLLQCFRGGRHVQLPPALDALQYAFTVWCAERCPKLEGEYYLLAAILNLLTEREPSLADVETPKLRSVLARALKKSRYSRLDSCWRFSLLLNQATGWQDMNAEFLTSHITAVEQAKRRHAAEEHLSKHICRRANSRAGPSVFSSKRKRRRGSLAASDGEDEKEQSSEGSGEEVADAVSSEEEDAHKVAAAEVNRHRNALKQDSGAVVALWDLQPHTLGHSHLTRVVQVVTEWGQKKSIRVLAVRALGAHIPEQLQIAFVSCFNIKGPPHENGLLAEIHHHKKRKPENVVKWQDEMWKAITSDPNLVNESQLPTLVLEDLPLPSVSLPKDRFPLHVLVERHLLWLVTHFVESLDLEPGPPGPVSLSDGRFSDRQAIGDSRALVNELCTAISRSRVLTHLNLRCSNLGEHGGMKLAAAIKACPQLESLDISNNNLGPKAATKLVLAADQGCSLTFLDLSRNKILDVGMQNLAQPLSHVKKLSTLRLGQNSCGHDGAEALAECMLTNTSLTSLTLCHNQISLQSVLTLVRVTQATCTLKELDLEHNLPWPSYGGSEFDVQQLAACLGGHTTDVHENVRTSCLTSLSLRHCNVRSESAAKLFEALVRNSTLEKLNISWNGIRHLGTIELARMLAEPRCKLHELDLRDNQVGTQDALGHALQQVFWRMSGSEFSTHNVRLQKLHLGNNELTANSVKLLVDSLPAFVALEELMLYHNPEIGQQGGQAIARLLSLNHLVGMTNLRRLSVAICSLGDVGCRAVATSLRTNDKLTALDLSGNHITDSSALPLAEALRSNRTLQFLNLTMNFITSVGLKQLMDALSTNDCSSIKEIDISAQAEPDFEALVSLSDEVLSKFVGLSH